MTGSCGCLAARFLMVWRRRQAVEQPAARGFCYDWRSSSYIICDQGISGEQMTAMMMTSCLAAHLYFPGAALFARALLRTDCAEGSVFCHPHHASPRAIITPGRY